MLGFSPITTVAIGQAFGFRQKKSFDKLLNSLANQTSFEFAMKGALLFGKFVVV